MRVPAGAGKGSVAAAAPKEAPERAMVPECAVAKAKLLARVKALLLPPNFLDHLIEELGGAKVLLKLLQALVPYPGCLADQKVSGSQMSACSLCD